MPRKRPETGGREGGADYGSQQTDLLAENRIKARKA
jgi:hypothetical protein